VRAWLHIPELDDGQVQGERQGEQHDGRREAEDVHDEHAVIVYERREPRNYDQGYGELETGWRSPVAKRS